MTATPFDASPGISSTGCSCPICTGRGLPQQIDTTLIANGTTAGTSSATATAGKNALSSLPQLSSSPGSTAKLVLDFNGNSLSTWGGYTNVVTKVYDIDGDAATFSDQELAKIREIWARVAEDYAPFNIDVTTVDPGVLTNRVVAKIAIGGSSYDWYGASAGGVAYIGGFSNSSPNVGFAFSAQLGNGNAKYVADAVSHEAGHLFGLQHQAKWNGSTFVADYNQGNANWAPLMGVGYYSATSTWSNGATSLSSTSFQDDMAILAGSINGFGYRVNTQGTAATAGTLGTNGTFNVSGLIAQNSDQQWWKFTTTGGAATFNVKTIAAGANLDSVLEIRNASGTVLYTANSSTSLNSTLSVSLASGTYYAVVRSTGVYGYVGQYTLTGTFTAVAAPPPPPPAKVLAPEITVLQGTKEIVNWTTYVEFGKVTFGAIVEKTITIRNDGNALLTLKPIDTTKVPSWLSITSNIRVTSLQAGQTTSFVVRLNATNPGGSYGYFSVNSNDANESAYFIQFTAAVMNPQVTTNGTANAALAFALVDDAMSQWKRR